MGDVTTAGAHDESHAQTRAQSDEAPRHVLLVRAGAWICALPITDVVETMRALPVRPVEGAPPFLRGVAIIRGSLLPVVHLLSLLGKAAIESGGRFVTVRTGAGQIALHVDAVIGAKHIEASALEETPPLLAEALSEHAEKIGALDGQMIALLRTARILPDAIRRELLGEGSE